MSLHEVSRVCAPPRNPAAWRGMRYPDSDLVGLIFRFVRPGREVAEGSRAIDVGCGPGRHLLLLNEIGFRAYGIDPDPRMVEQARTNGFEVSCASLEDHTADEPLALALFWGFMCLAPGGEALAAKLKAEYVIADWRSPENSCFHWEGNERLPDGSMRLHQPGHVLDGQVYRAHQLESCELPGYERIHWQNVTKATCIERNGWFQTVHRIRG